MATHSIILAWRIPWTEEPGGLQSMGLQESDMTQRLNHHHQFLKKPIYFCVQCWHTPPDLPTLFLLPIFYLSWFPEKKNSINTLFSIHDFQKTWLLGFARKIISDSIHLSTNINPKHLQCQYFYQPAMFYRELPHSTLDSRSISVG